jgi:hypothetical protein
LIRRFLRELLPVRDGRRLSRHIFKTGGRIIVQNPATAFAVHDLLAALQVLEKLEAKRDVALGAASIDGFGHRYPAPAFSYALVIGEHMWREL